MLRLYDNAICEDLQRSFNRNNVDNPVVRVIDSEGILPLVAQIKEDKCTFPIIAVKRSPNMDIDTTRRNFTGTKFGVVSVIDPETNNLYYEKSLPITLSYDMSILTTNVADMDELVREILFKYSNMYFLTIKLPYEADRKVRFGIQISEDSTVEGKSSTYEYLSSGRLYESVIKLNCEGCVLVTYTPAHLVRNVSDIGMKNLTFNNI